MLNEEDLNLCAEIDWNIDAFFLSSSSFNDEQILPKDVTSHDYTTIFEWERFEISRQNYMHHLAL